MFKQALSYILLAGLWLTTSFKSPQSDEKWSATIRLEGKKDAIVLTSEGVYGGYNPIDKRIFLFGKNHMFVNKADNNRAQVFRDLCTTNASGQFQFELNNILNPTAPVKATNHSGNISFKKKTPISGTFKNVLENGKNVETIVVNGDFKALGFQMTEEAEKIMTGKFTLTFTSKN
jgi:hypothetical protein